MPEYRLAQKTVEIGKYSYKGKTQWKSVEIPDDAEFVEVNYSSPGRMGESELKAEIRYLVPVEGGEDA